MSGIFFLPLLGALIGWCVNRATLWMLFHPTRPVNFGLFKLHGIFPAQQKRLGEELGKMVSEQFFSFDTISQKLTDPSKIKAIKPHVEEHLEQFLRVKLPQSMPMIAMFIGDSTINQIKTTLADELDILFPKLISQYLDNVKSELDLRQIVSAKIAALSAEQVETAFRQKLGSGISKLGWMCALIGFLLGLIVTILLAGFTIFMVLSI